MLFELSLSIVSFLIASYFIIVSFSLDYKNPVLAENSVFFPFVVSIFLVFLGILNLISVLKKYNWGKKDMLGPACKTELVAPPDWDRSKEYCQVKWSKDVFIYMGLILIYLIILGFIGYLITSIAFCIAYILIYKMKIKSRSSIIIAIIIPVVIWAIFRFALKVALP